jgi:phage shock protein PspC (stress-responsive transcriptional regulator)
VYLVSFDKLAFCSHHSVKVLGVCAGAAVTLGVYNPKVKVKIVTATKASFMILQVIQKSHSNSTIFQLAK